MKLSTLFALAMLALLAAAGCGPKEKTSSRKGMALSGTVLSADPKEADKLYAEGLKFYRKGRPGQPDSNKNLQEASKRFRAARNIYERAAEDDPADKRLPRRIQDCNVKIYSCAKMQTL